MTDYEPRFISYVILQQPSAIGADALKTRLAERFFGGAETEVSVSTSGEGEAIIATVVGVPVTVMQIDKPLPQDVIQTALDLNRTWPSAKEDIAQQTGHLIVANLSNISDHASAVAAAVAVTYVTAACIDLTLSIGVVWSSGDALSSANEFNAAATGLMNKAVPVLNWVSLTVLQGPAIDGRGSIAVITTGLRPFTSREIEFVPSSLPPQTVVERVIGTSQYLIMNGPVIKDGETLGISETERIAVRFADLGHKPTTPTMMLEPSL